MRSPTGTPATLALRLVTALLAFGIVGLVSSILHWVIAFSMSPPPDDVSVGDFATLTPGRMAIASIIIVENLARVGLLFHAIARRSRPIDSLVIPCVVGGVGLFGLAATQAASAIGTAFLARSNGTRLIAEVAMATNLGHLAGQVLWWLGLAGLFVYCAILVARDSNEVEP
jgi:hypothetical protein